MTHHTPHTHAVHLLHLSFSLLSFTPPIHTHTHALQRIPFAEDEDNDRDRDSDINTAGTEEREGEGEEDEAGGLYCALYKPDVTRFGEGPYPCIVSVYGGTYRTGQDVRTHEHSFKSYACRQGYYYD